MEKSYTTTINWQVVNMRKKDKNFPRLHSTVIYVLEKEGCSPSFGVGTIYGDERFPTIYSGMIRVPIKTGLKWCYVDELKIVEQDKE